LEQLTATYDAAPDTAAHGSTAAVDGATFFRRLIEGMRCGILVIDRSGRVITVNDHAGTILELQRLPARGEPVDVALAEHPQLARILRESFSMSRLPNRAEIDLKSRSENGKTIGFTLSLVPGDDGAPFGAALFFKDLTYVEHTDESSKELLEKIVAEVKRLNRTITSSLEFVRPVSLVMTAASIDGVLDEALTVALGRCGRTSGSVERRTARRLPEFLMDRGQLRQVFENLFINAFEAMGPSGRLVIEVGREAAPAAPSTPYRPLGAPDPAEAFDAYCVVRVIDTGTGVAEEHLDKLFYPFFTTKTQGSGVGLSMAKKIVDSHRGVIDVQSKVGVGTAFTVRLPMIGSGSGETHS